MWRNICLQIFQFSDQNIERFHIVKFWLAAHFILEPISSIAISYDISNTIFPHVMPFCIRLRDLYAFRIAELLFRVCRRWDMKRERRHAKCFAERISIVNRLSRFFVESYNCNELLIHFVMRAEFVYKSVLQNIVSNALIVSFSMCI